MAKSQYEVIVGVLRKLLKAGVLDHVVLIGSWCMLFYKDFFRIDTYTPSIRTRDIDILIPIPHRVPVKVDLPSLLQDLGFVLEFKGRGGYMQFMHPDLMLEFLVPERGRDSDKPYLVPKLGVNAQPLRYLDLLLRNAIRLTFEGVPIHVPHPANFAIHKLIISGRRTGAKAQQDQAQAIAVLVALKEIGKLESARQVLDSIPVTWRRAAMKAARETGEAELLS